MATPISTTSDPASPPAPRSGRQQTISYADLMKPDEDWRNLPNPADRRKIQNRLAQRAYSKLFSLAKARLVVPVAHTSFPRTELEGPE